MSQKLEKIVLLIDYENIQNINLAIIEQKNIEIKIFVGKTQNKIPFDLVQAAQQFKNKIEWIKIKDSASNALDFYIAFYLGQYFKYIKKGTFLVLSKDKGFDPLIKYINKSNINCRRIENLDCFSQKLESSLPDEESTMLILEVINQLSEIETNKHPTTKKALHNYLRSQLASKKLQEREITILVEKLIEQKKVVQNNNRLKYNF